MVKKFFLKKTHIGVNFLRGIEAWKRFPDPDSGKMVGVLKRKCKKFKRWTLYCTLYFALCIVLCTVLSVFCTKYSTMYSIRIFYIFASINTPFSLNQNQESVFTLRFPRKFTPIRIPEKNFEHALKILLHFYEKIHTEMNYWFPKTGSYTRTRQKHDITVLQ